MEAITIDNTDIIAAINELKGNVDRFLDNILKDEEISRVHVLILLSLSEKRKKECKANVNDIVTSLALNQGNTSSVLKKMEKMNLIERTRNKQDERKVEIALTKYGREKLDIVEERIRKIEKALKNEYTNNEKDRLMNGIGELNKMVSFMIKEEEKI